MHPFHTLRPALALTMATAFLGFAVHGDSKYAQASSSPIVAHAHASRDAQAHPSRGADAGLDQAPGEPTPDLFDPEVVRDFFVTFADADWEAKLARTGEDSLLRADLVVEGVAYPGVGMRYKGITSSRVPGHKKPFSLSVDGFAPGQRLMGYDTLNLNNGYSDPSMIREMLGFAVLRPFLPSPKAAFVKLHINGAYFGLYGLVQQIERTYIKEWFPGTDGLVFKADSPPMAGGTSLTPTGWEVGDGWSLDQRRVPLQRTPLQRSPLRLTPLQQPPPGGPIGLASELYWRGEGLNLYKQNYELKTDAPVDPSYTLLRDLIRTLAAPTDVGGTADEAFEDAVAGVLDVDSALWYLAANNLTVNLDSYYFGHNYYLYRNASDGRFSILHWDMNTSFGIFLLGGSDGAAPAPAAETSPFLQSTVELRPLVRRLLAVPRYRADYLAHYRTLRRAVFDAERLGAQARQYQALIRKAVETDPNRLYSFYAFDQNLDLDVQISMPGPNGQSFSRTIPGLLPLLRNRASWLDRQAVLAEPDLTLASHTRTPETPAEGAAVVVTLRLAGADVPTGVELTYRVNLGRPVRLNMAADGDAWTAMLPEVAAGAKVSYFARAALADGRAVFYPAANFTQPWQYAVPVPQLPVVPAGDLVVNELMADNERTLADEAREYDDWIELYNRGQSPIALGAYALTTDLDEPRAFRLPDTTLSPGAHLLVWCDGQVTQGSLHAPFKLKKSGERVWLVGAIAVEDQVAYGPLRTDRSWARMPDGGVDWVTCRDPSPGRANACRAEGTVVWLPWLRAEGVR